MGTSVRRQTELNEKTLKDKFRCLLFLRLQQSPPYRSVRHKSCSSTPRLRPPFQRHHLTCSKTIAMPGDISAVPTCMPESQSAPLHPVRAFTARHPSNNHTPARARAPAPTPRAPLPPSKVSRPASDKHSSNAAGAVGASPPRRRRLRQSARSLQRSIPPEGESAAAVRRRLQRR